MHGPRQGLGELLGYSVLDNNKNVPPLLLTPCLSLNGFKCIIHNLTISIYTSWVVHDPYIIIL